MSSTEFQGADASPEVVPVIVSESAAPPYSAALLDRIAALLPAYLVSRRWFRAKTRAIEQVAIHDVVELSPASALFVLRVQYKQGPEDRYLLPLSIAPLDDALRHSPSTEIIAALHTPQQNDLPLYSAFANPGFRSALLTAIDTSATFRGTQGLFIAHKVAVPASAPVLDPLLASTVSRAEQSNTSVIYGDRFILKLFRKVEEGVNPDIEVGAFLTEHGFANTPAVLGTLEYRSHDGGPYAAGLLQSFVRNRGDAWSFTLEALAGFFHRAIASPGDTPDAIGPYLQSARLLGVRTAEMHATLAGGSEPAFQPEPFTSADAEDLYAEMQRQADTAFAVLRLKESSLSGDAAAEAHHVLEREAILRQRFDALRSSTLTAHRIRFHGDYHLGQVLYTGDDFMIIDFEGEPARPLHERRQKTLAIRDVAGMVRSFQYAAYAALFGQVGGEELRRASSGDISRWAAAWYQNVTQAYLSGYFETAGAAQFLPPSEAERQLLLNAFLLHKALYEVAYELNNRPAWVRIPLRGILSLIA